MFISKQKIREMEERIEKIEHTVNCMKGKHEFHALFYKTDNSAYVVCKHCRARPENGR